MTEEYRSMFSGQRKSVGRLLRDARPESNAMIEALEPRVLLSATLDGGVLDIAGDDAANAIVIEVGAADGEVVLTGVPDVVDGTTFVGVTEVNILAGAGDDTITIDAGIGVPVSVDGEAGSDTLVIDGSDTEGDQFQVSQGKGEQAGDLLIVRTNLTPLDLDADGIDGLTINGGGGNDKIKLQRLTGTDLRDSLITINGGDGDDKIIGSKAGRALDLNGNDGDDRLIGSKKDDVLDGGDGNDILKGNAGNDDLFGDTGNDKLFGGNGNDVLEGEEGVDRLNGGRGRDTASYRRSTGFLNISLRAKKAFNDGFGFEDRKVKNIENVDGTDQSDLIEGDRRNNELFGFAGGDLMYGLAGDDFLDAGAGDGAPDQLFGFMGIQALNSDGSPTGLEERETTVLVPLLDSSGNPVLDTDGNPIFTNNFLGRDVFFGCSEDAVADGGDGDFCGTFEIPAADEPAA